MSVLSAWIVASSPSTGIPNKRPTGPLLSLAKALTVSALRAYRPTLATWQEARCPARAVAGV